MARDDFVAYMKGWAADFGAPVRAGAAVTALSRRGGDFLVTTDAGDMTAKAVVVATARRVLRIISRLAIVFVTLFAGSFKPYWRLPAVIPVVTVVDLPASLFDIAGAGCLLVVWQPALILGLRCRGSRQYAGHQRDRCRANGQIRSESRGTCQHDFLLHW